ncbi:dephospho-CoA kinase [Vagococcus coleopterorum]|uniref:Dephospho-CoA kinase n=1 Tax=Vagococcus coleopterorum TaxID=2714946 RepID=A0A6G8AND0_9ENTE|nr:dephospho-CoA kinase [Vagococcus coleopterorum]QIL46433.1 dephospho-CoA kinase [Vagococcus coleopterorum]
MTKVVGLTGGIATGKSTVSRYFSEVGYPVIDADIIAREVVEPGEPGLAQVVAYFGESILLEDGHLNRKRLGEIIFNDSEKRRKLDAILDDEIRGEISTRIEEQVKLGAPLVIVDIPLLYEAHYDEMMDEIIVVGLSEKIQLERLCARNKLTEEEGLARLASQMPISEKIKLADVIIDNSGTIPETYQQIDQWLVKNKKIKPSHM